MSFPLSIAKRWFYPLSKMLISLTSIIEKKLAHRASNNLASKAEIGEAIDLTVKGGFNANEEVDILKSIVTFGDVSVKQIMQPRVDVIAVDFQSTYQELISVVKKSGYSRIPIYKDTVDNITGIVLKDDLLQHLVEDEDNKQLKELRRDVISVRDDEPLPKIFETLTKKDNHLAVVVDNYGTLVGIVTLEDVLETLLGLEITDESDGEADLQALARRKWEQRAKERGLIE